MRRTNGGCEGAKVSVECKSLSVLLKSEFPLIISVRANESSWHVQWWHSRTPVSPHPVGYVVNFYRNSQSMARTYPCMPPSRPICRCASFAPACCNCCQTISVSLTANRAKKCQVRVNTQFGKCGLTVNQPPICYC